GCVQHQRHLGRRHPDHRPRVRAHDDHRDRRAARLAMAARSRLRKRWTMKAISLHSRMTRGGDCFVASLLAMTIVLSLVAAPVRAQAQPLTKVSIAVPLVAAVTMPIYYARDGGIFKKHGIDADVQLFRGGPPANAALLSGDVQFLVADPYEFLKVADSRRAIRVLTLVHGFTFDFVVSNDFIKKHDIDLKAAPKARL